MNMNKVWMEEDSRIQAIVDRDEPRWMEEDLRIQAIVNPKGKSKFHKCESMVRSLTIKQHL